MKYFKWIMAVLLTPISIFALGVVYNTFKLNQFEWGNISDWVSALSSFGALIVALMVYKAVPKLIHQKSDEYSFSIANIIIFDSIPDIIYGIEKLTNPFHPDQDLKYCFKYDKFIDLKDTLEDHESDFSKLLMNVRKLEKDIKSLKRLGWNFRGEQNKFYEMFLEQMPLFYSVYIASSTRISLWLWPRDSGSNEDNYEESLKCSQDELFQLKIRFTKESEALQKILNNLLDSKLRVEDFFTRNTK
ncbi:hypothetical protein [Pectobacterium parvum]|uniref:hypothetical protein n=1 Tax=Pectobacterium parvum TaxID=2778550 RepID=UPI000DD0BD4A|nr:hypothetical protein [Pectobacterium parvum]